MLEGSWRRRLVDHYPDIFVRTDHGEASVHGYPFVGEGWSDIVEVLIERIAARAPRGSHRIDLIGEKHGWLVLGVQRVQAGLDSDILAAVDEAVALAEARSACTCQICGESGVMRDDHGWLATLCDGHARGEPVPVRRGWENIELVIAMTGGHPRASRARRYDRRSDSFVEVDPSTLETEE